MTYTSGHDLLFISKQEILMRQERNERRFTNHMHSSVHPIPVVDIFNLPWRSDHVYTLDATVVFILEKKNLANHVIMISNVKKKHELI